MDEWMEFSWDITCSKIWEDKGMWWQWYSGRIWWLGTMQYIGVPLGVEIWEKMGYIIIITLGGEHWSWTIELCH